MVAATYGYRVIQHLIDGGAIVNTQSVIRQTALILAARRGSIDAVRSLIAAGALLDLQDEGGVTALLYAAANSHVGVVRLLLDAGATADVQNINGCTALIHAACINDIQIMRALSTANADANAQSNGGNTPLMLALGSQWRHCPSGHTGSDQAVSILLSAGADPNITNTTGLSALIFAARLGRVAPVKALIHAGADVFFSSATGVLYIPKKSPLATIYGRFFDNPSPEEVLEGIAQHPGNHVDVLDDYFTALDIARIDKNRHIMTAIEREMTRRKAASLSVMPQEMAEDVRRSILQEAGFLSRCRMQRYFKNQPTGHEGA